jgi:hypothetical protein
MNWMTSSSPPPISMMIWPSIIGVLPQQHLISSRRNGMSSWWLQQSRLPSQLVSPCH